MTTKTTTKPLKLKKKEFSECVEYSSCVSLDDFMISNSKKEVLVFDTNFLFVPFEFKVEIISEIKNILGNSVTFAIVEETIEELEAIEKKGDKNKKFLPLISTLLKRYEFSIIQSNYQKHKKNTYVDDILYALPNTFVIATNDKELKQRLWKIPKKVIFMRQMSYLDIK